MTTMLERAARSMEDRLYQMEQGEDGPDCYRRLGRSEYAELTRAVLVAVREPDIDMDEEIMANFADPCWQEDAKSGFTAMIDAILNEDSAK